MGSVTYGTLVKNRFGANRRIMMVGKEGYSSVRGAINDCGEMGKIFICGGQRVYEEALSMDTDVTIYSSHIRGDYGCDRFVSLPGGGEIIYEDEDMTIKMNILRYNVQA